MDADREALLTAAERLNADVIEKAEARLISRPSDGPHAKILAKATQHARALFGQLQHRRHFYPNPHRQLDELQQACTKLNQLLDLMDGTHQSPQGGEKEKEKTKPQQQQQQPNNNNNHFAATDALSHPSAKQFWAAHFGPQTYEVAWEKLKKAFAILAKDISPHTKELKVVGLYLTRTCQALADVGKVHISSSTPISVLQFAFFTDRHGPIDSVPFEEDPDQMSKRSVLIEGISEKDLRYGKPIRQLLDVCGTVQRWKAQKGSLLAATQQWKTQKGSVLVEFEDIPMGIADHFKANKVQAQCKAVSEDICKVSLISPRKISKVNRACASTLLQELVPQRKNLKRQIRLLERHGQGDNSSAPSHASTFLANLLNEKKRVEQQIATLQNRFSPETPKKGKTLKQNSDPVPGTSADKRSTSEKRRTMDSRSLARMITKHHQQEDGTHSFRSTSQPDLNATIAKFNAMSSPLTERFERSKLPPPVSQSASTLSTSSPPILSKIRNPLTFSNDLDARDSHSVTLSHHQEERLDRSSSSSSLSHISPDSDSSDSNYNGNENNLHEGSIKFPSRASFTQDIEATFTSLNTLNTRFIERENEINLTFDKLLKEKEVYYKNLENIQQREAKLKEGNRILNEKQSKLETRELELQSREKVILQREQELNELSKQLDTEQKNLKEEKDKLLRDRMRQMSFLVRTNKDIEAKGTEISLDLQKKEEELSKIITEYSDLKARLLKEHEEWEVRRKEEEANVLKKRRSTETRALKEINQQLNQLKERNNGLEELLVQKAEVVDDSKRLMLCSTCKSSFSASISGWKLHAGESTVSQHGDTTRDNSKKVPIPRLPSLASLASCLPPLPSPVRSPSHREYLHEGSDFLPPTPPPPPLNWPPPPIEEDFDGFRIDTLPEAPLPLPPPSSLPDDIPSPNPSLSFALPPSPSSSSTHLPSPSSLPTSSLSPSLKEGASSQTASSSNIKTRLIPALRIDLSSSSSSTDRPSLPTTAPPKSARASLLFTSPPLLAAASIEEEASASSPAPPPLPRSSAVRIRRLSRFDEQQVVLMQKIIRCWLFRRRITSRLQQRQRCADGDSGSGGDGDDGATPMALTVLQEAAAGATAMATAAAIATTTTTTTTTTTRLPKAK